MRKAFVRGLVSLAERDPRVVLLTADLGYTVVEPFAERFPQRFFNVGVAEQNMVGVATGLAEAGFVPFLYSIATFATLRPYEFIRNGPVLHRLPVRIVGVGGGFEYGHAGVSHHGIEDVGAMRLLPGMSVVVPADYAQASAALFSTWDLPGAVYYRLGKNDRDLLPGLDGRYRHGRVEILRHGDRALVLCCGAIAFEAVAAAERLAASGVECTVALVASVSPPPLGDLVDLLAGFPVAVTVEAHSISGGIGSLVAEVIAERALSCRLHRLGVRAPADGVTGDETYLLERNGLSATCLVSAVRSAVGDRDGDG